MENIYYRLAELIKIYKKAKEGTYDEGACWVYDRVIDDLEYMLYGREHIKE